MANTIVFENALLKVLGKCGINKPDSEGRYTVVLGVLGDTATSGDLYVDNPKVRKTFAPGSRLQTMIERGLGWGEWGHPKPHESPSPEAFKQRVKVIDERMISHIVHKVWLEPMVWEGRNVTGIMGKITPCGPYGKHLKQILDDPQMNAAFSGRYFSDYALHYGQCRREIHTVVAWDFVFMPGMPGATKYMSPTLESAAYEDTGTLTYTMEDLIVMDQHEQESGIVTMENGGITARELMAAANMRMPERKRDLLASW